jgi:hypothetical protein
VSESWDATSRTGNANSETTFEGLASVDNLKMGLRKID